MARNTTASKSKESSVPKAISKAKAAKAALDAGIEGPQDAVAFIMREFDIEMSPQHFSAVKSLVKKKEFEAMSPSRKDLRLKKKSTAIEGYLAPPSKPTGKPDADLLDMMEAMKPLIAHYGPDRVKRIVDLLG